MTLSTTLPSPPRRLFPSFRLLIVLLTMMAFFCTSTMKGNLGVAMVCMVNSTAVSKQPHPSDANISVDPSLTKCHSGNADEGASRQAADYRGELLWTQQMQSHLFAASYYGSLVVAVPSGYIADIYGPKYVLLVSVADCAVMSFLGPFLANTNYYLFFASRVVLGLGEGLVLPGISSMAANWSPANERSTLAAIYTSGNQLSGAIGSVVSSSFCKLHFLGGWPLIFYFFGLVGVVFIVVWYFVTTNSPSSNRWIGNDEKAYLESELRHMSETRQTAVVPWLKLITSPRIIAILLCYSTFGFVNVIMQSYLPTFFKTVLHLKVLHNGFFTAIPWLSQLIGKNVLSLISDYFKRNGYFKPTTLVKIFQSIHGFGLALTMIALALFVDCTRTTLATFLLTSMGLCMSAIIPGYFTSQLSVAPAFTGTITSFANMAGVISMLITPLVINALLEDETPEGWKNVFYTAAGLSLVSCIFFLVFGSAKEERWLREHQLQQQNAIRDGVSVPLKEGATVDVDSKLTKIEA